ncbi:MAG: archease [Candidatus Woesearchaeota archaeon]
MKYKFLPHTADAKFQAFGETLEEAFANAALAMFSVMTDTEKVRPMYEEEIFVEGRDTKSLLYAFLEELLFLLDTKKFLLNKIKEIRISQENDSLLLKAVATGDIDLQEYEVHGEVKAVTYNDMEIYEAEGKFTIQVVVDL